MEKIGIVFLFFFTCLKIFAQNLVPNPSFESYTQCPPQISGVNPPDYVKFASPWYLPTEGSGDYFNSCNTADVGTPTNIMGYQLPRTGNAYVGLIIMGDQGYPNTREYIQVPLLHAMDPDKNYEVSFYVSLAEIAYRATDDIGIYFSEGPYIDISGTSFHVLPFTPQVKNTPGNFLDSKTEWMKVSASYQPDKPYTHITIGNFDNNINSPYMQLYDPNPTDVYKELSYYFIDDVSVFENVDNTCPKDIQLFIPNLITPNGDGHNDLLEIIGIQKGKGELLISNIWGDQVFKSKNYSNDWSGIGLPAGIYYYGFTYPACRPIKGWVEIVK